MSPKKKWFDKKKPQIGRVPIRDQTIRPATNEAICKMIDELREANKRLFQSTVDFLMRLVILPPSVRLKVNLQILLKLMTANRVESVLAEGLTDEERAILIDLQLKQVPTEAIETAHSLLNIPERAALVNVLGATFHSERHRATGHLGAEEAQARLTGKKPY